MDDMDAIQLIFKDGVAENLFGRSKWWGAPDLPAGSPYPTVPCSDDGDDWDEPLTFLCQIRCGDLAELDPDGWLPHEGMLYFFAAVDYFLGEDCPIFTCIGEWDRPCVRVMYSSSCDGLEPYEMHWEESGESVFRDPLAMEFEKCPDRAPGFKLLGHPWLEEINEQYEDCVSLLQVDENDDWGLRFYDCGMLCLLLRPEELRARSWGSVFGYLHSF